MKKIIIPLICTICLCGCKSLKQTVEVPVYVHDTAYMAKEVHDSTYIDRWHTIIEKGDTVRMHDSIVMYKYIFKTDTAYKYIEVPVTVTKTEVVEVKKPLTWWQKTQQGGFWVLLLVLSGVLLWRVLPLLLPTKNSN